MKPHKKQTIIPPNWEIFLQALAEKIAMPTEKHPTVRCWTLASLAIIIQEIKRSKKLPSTFPNTPEILKHLINIKWAHPVSIDISPSTKLPRSKIFFLLDAGASHEANVDSLELLQAYKPNGVICYFSALTYHSLTTQFTAHHHIAVYKAASVPKENYKRPFVVDKSKTPRMPPKKLSLGEKIFTHQGVPCYLTKRTPSLLPGVQTRILGPRTNIRITSLEQTMLDTLHKPTYCGGPSVVFEVWEEGITRFDEELLNDYLLKINSQLLVRRIGAMFDMLNFKPDSELNTTLENEIKSFSNTPDLSPVPILPGFEFHDLNPKWKVLTL